MKKEKARKISLLRVGIICVLGIFLAASVLNMHAAYSKPLEKTITVPDNEYYLQTTFDYQATMYNNSLYGPSTFKSDVYFTELTRWLDGTIEFEFAGSGEHSSITDYDCYVLLKSEKEYWEKRFPVSNGNRKGKFKESFSVDITEYRNFIQTIEDQTKVRGNNYKISIVTEMNVTATRKGESVQRKIAPTLTFDMNNKLLKVDTNSTQTVEKNLFFKNKVIPTGAEKNRETSLLFLVISVIVLLTGIVIAIKKPIVIATEEEKNKRKYKPIEGKTEEGVFYVENLEDLSKVAKATERLLFYNKKGKEYFVRAEGKEYKYIEN